MSKKKIALVYDAIFPYVKGGAERRFYELGKQFAQEGNEVHLYGMQFWPGKSIIEVEGCFLHGLCKARPLYTESGRRSISQAIIFGLSCFKLMWEDFDAIDCCSFPYFSLYVCKLITLLKRKKLYATWHEVWGKRYWQEYLGWMGVIGFLIEKIAVKLPDEIIAVSQHTANALQNTFKTSQPIHVIGNGIHPNEIESIKPSKTLSDLIYVGRLMDFKHVDVLLQSVAIIKEKKPNVSCIIIGNGPELEKLQALAESLNLNESVMFTGFEENHEKIIGMMKSSKVFVLPSTREGFGMSVIEANACGLPVITINHKNNAAQELIKEGINGFIVDLDARIIASKIWDILENSGTLKPKYEIEQYNWSHITERLERVLNTV